MVSCATSGAGVGGSNPQGASPAPWWFVPLASVLGNRTLTLVVRRLWRREDLDTDGNVAVTESIWQFPKLQSCENSASA